MAVLPGLLALLPFVLADVMLAALGKLGLGPATSLLAAAGGLRPVGWRAVVTPFAAPARS